MNTPAADAEPLNLPWISPRRAGDGSRMLAEYVPAETVRRTTSAPLARPQLTCRDLFKSYYKGALGIPVLQGIDLEVREGEFLAIVGQSGSGKSTLLHLLATLDSPDAGTINFQGHRIDNMPASARDLIRNRHFGMVFQFYHLLPELSALQNILTPAMIAESTVGYLMKRATYRRRAYELLDVVGLAHRAKHKPRELSGGEMQRAAIARALLMRPKVLMADEPTGNLDRSTGEQIMQTLCDLNRREGLTIVMVTHDPWIAGQADRTVQLVEGTDSERLAIRSVFGRLINGKIAVYHEGMEIPLSPQQRDAINAHPGEPLPLVDDLSSERYFLVPAPAFLHLQGLAEDSEQRCHEQLRKLIQEGIDSPTVPAHEAFSRLRRTAQRLADESK